MTHTGRQGERRTFGRLDITIPLTMQLVRGSGRPAAIEGETENITPDGLSIIIRIKIGDIWTSPKGKQNLRQLAPYLALDGRVVDLGIQILPHGATIQMRGRVTWCERGLKDGWYHLKAGISIEAIAREYQEEWLEFLRTVMRLHDGCTLSTKRLWSLDGR